MGKVLLHSRKAFEALSSREEYKLEGMLWAMKSMNKHNLDNIVFGSKEADLVEAVNRPKAWPFYKFQVSKLMEVLCKFKEWKLQSENR